MAKKKMIHDFLQMKSEGDKITFLTAYDYPTALAMDKAGVDSILVGDSLGMVVLGYDSTIPVTLDAIVHHTRAVVRGAKKALIVADLPFMSYASPEQALDNAVRLMQEGGAMMVKLEGGDDQVEIVRHLARHDIPVFAHIGLKPQSVHKIGGFKVQGREPDQAREMRDAARRLQDAGADIVLLECVPNEVGEAITEALQTGILEDPGAALPLDDGKLDLEFRPFEIKTVRAKMSDQGIE